MENRVVGSESKLKFVKNSVKPWGSSNLSNRLDEIVLTCLRIGHCYETHSYFFNNGDPPKCEKCDLPLSVKHILMDCKPMWPARTHFRKIKPTHNIRLKVLLGESMSVSLTDIISFLKYIRFKVIYTGY